MTSDGTQEGTASTTNPVAAALAAWSADPRLAAALRGEAGGSLVLSGDGGRILHAVGPAEPLAAAIADEAGRVAGGLRLADQIGRAGLRAGAISLMRLHLDPRRIAPPVTCLLSRGEAGDGAPAILLAFDKPVAARLRRPQAAPRVEEASPEAVPMEPVPEPEPGIVPGARFVWRSDAEGRLGDSAGGTVPALNRLFAGQAWNALAKTGRLLDGDALLAALAAQRTFRAVPVALALSEPARTVALDVSGAPVARAGQSFAGYAGFGLIRSVAEIAAAMPPQPAEPPSPEVPPAETAVSGLAAPAGTMPLWTTATEGAASAAASFGRFWLSGPAPESVDRVPPAERPAPAPSTAVALDDSVPATAVAAESPASVLAVEEAPTRPPVQPEAPAAADMAAPSVTERFQAIWELPEISPVAGPAASADDLAHAPLAANATEGAHASAEEPPAAPAPVSAPPTPVEAPAEPATEDASEDENPPLSVNEHAAFREIAKALGARFAGDDEEPADARPESVAGFRPAGGSVTPFPSRPVEAAPDEAVALLDGIPAALMICRGETLLHANRRLLDLAGFTDLASLQAEGGLARLFRGLPPQRHAAGVSAVALATREGGSRDIEIEQARIAWLGDPAECLLVRPRAAGDAGRGDTAAALADTVVQRRASDAEAVLDDLDEAVIGLDGAGRVLSLNRAAAALFGCEPREVVGGSFSDLFQPDSARAVRALTQVPDAGACEVAARVGGMKNTGRLSLSAARPDGRRVAVLREAPVERHAVPNADAAAGGDADFAARIGQELRAPVTGIVGFADVMLSERYGPLGDERYRGTAGDIRNSGEQVLALVDDLVDLSQIESGRRDLAFGPLTLNDLVGDCVAHLQPQAAGGRVLLRTSFAADLPAVIADEASLRQAALAVIAGAIRSTAAGGQVIVSTTQAERGEVALRVRDTGSGLPEVETAPVVAVARKDGAPGLGLPLTRALVEANHGRFRVSSRKDEGTLVEMLFSVRGAALRA